jgi:MscS family membrane protein
MDRSVVSASNAQVSQTSVENYTMRDKIWSRIRLIAFGKQSLDVELYAYVIETDFTQFLIVQEELLLRIMDIIAANGVNVAMPAQMTLLDREAAVESKTIT